jgi:hypothetical protein
MRDTTEKLQHRRHRAVYLAPTAIHLQHFSSQSYDSGEDYFGSDDAYDDHDKAFILDDLRIPLFVEIPQEDNLRFPVISPPCSNGSEMGPLLSPVLSEAAQQHQTLQWPFEEDEQYRQKESSPSQSQRRHRHRRRPFKERLYKLISSVLVVMYDFLLLISVCLMGLFFHVEVQVVKQRAHHGRRGRIIVQKQSSATAAEMQRQQRQRQYQSTDLLRPLQQRSPPSGSFLMGVDDMV